MLAVNTGSDSISVMEFTVAGLLKPVDGSPFWSGGHNPVSLAVIPGHVVVANKACDGSTQPNYALLSLGADGRLAVFSTKQQRLPMGASPSIAYVTPGGHQLFGTEFLDQSRQDLARRWQIDAYAIDSQGSMTHAPNAPFAVPQVKLSPLLGQPPSLALNLVAHPFQNLIYAGLVSQNRLGVFSYDDLGALTPVAHTEASAGQWPAFFRVDQNGRYLYSSNMLSGSVSTWDLSNPRAPVEKSVLALLGSRSGTPFIDSDGTERTFSSEPYQLSLDESGQHLYVLSQRVTTNTGDRNGNMLHVLDVGVAGLLDERLPPIELSTLGLDPYARPQGVLVVPMK
ncbi:MAG: beta-propeller fold lactonase family protein [Myxococcaceae bacterium]